MKLVVKSLFLVPQSIGHSSCPSENRVQWQCFVCKWWSSELALPLVLFRHRLGDMMTIGSDSFGLVRAHRLSLVSLYSNSTYPLSVGHPNYCIIVVSLVRDCDLSEWISVGTCVVSKIVGWLVLIRIIIVTHCGFVNISVERAKRSFIPGTIHEFICTFLGIWTISLLLFY